MFTGLVEDVGRVSRIDALASGRGRRLTIQGRNIEEPLPLGASLAVDGVCLTVVAWQRGLVSVEVGPETIERTTLGALQSGQPVNLERPLRIGDPLGGHLVAGHVDAVGRIERMEPRGEAVDVTVSAPVEILRYVVEKGSIAIDGVSLTVNRVDERGFDVSLIPFTQSRTTLTKKAVSQSVNLEVDIIGKYVEKLLGGYRPSTGPGASGGLDLAKLKEHGFADQ
jgi:riboflavin synthase